MLLAAAVLGHGCSRPPNGPAAGRAADSGGHCALHADCASGFCVAGVCCDRACVSSCMSCRASDTGVPDGTCAFVAARSDPHQECEGATLCDGRGGCAPSTAGSWSRGFAGEGALGGLAIDSEGNVLVAGGAAGKTDWGAGPLRRILGQSAGSAGTVSDMGGLDGFAVKLDPTGRQLWGLRFGGPGNEVVTDLALDAAGRAWIVGTFDQRFVLAGETLATTGAAGWFLATVGPTGLVTQAAVLATVSADTESSTVDPAAEAGNAGEVPAPRIAARGGGVVIAGVLHGSLALVGSARAKRGIAVLAIDGEGQLQWGDVLEVETGPLPRLGGLAVSAADRIGLGGGFEGRLRVGETRLEASEAAAGFVVELGPDGRLGWASTLPTSVTTAVTSISAEPAGGWLAAGPGSGNAVAVARLGAEGKLLWHRLLDVAPERSGPVIASYGTGQALVTGHDAASARAMVLELEPDGTAGQRWPLAPSGPATVRIAADSFGNVALGGAHDLGLTWMAADRTLPECGRAASCAMAGRCSGPAASCRAEADEACRQSQLCARDGQCSRSADRCVAGRDEDCRGSRACAAAELCRAVAGECVR